MKYSLVMCQNESSFSLESRKGAKTEQLALKFSVGPRVPTAHTCGSPLPELSFQCVKNLRACLELGFPAQKSKASALKCQPPYRHKDTQVSLTKQKITGRSMQTTGKHTRESHERVSLVSVQRKF